MAHSNSIVLTDAVLVSNFSGTIPYNITIDPRNVVPLKKVFKIVYDFKDGTSPIVKKLFHSNGKTDIKLPIPGEPGDPRNFIVTKDITLEDQISKVFDVEVKVFWIQDPEDLALNYKIFTINLDLKAPALNAISNNKFFEALHLSNSRMFGTDNTLLYNFESINPFYALPVIVNWRPKSAINKTFITYAGLEILDLKTIPQSDGKGSGGYLSIQFIGANRPYELSLGGVKQYVSGPGLPVTWDGITAQAANLYITDTVSNLTKVVELFFGFRGHSLATYNETKYKTGETIDL